MIGGFDETFDWYPIKNIGTVTRPIRLTDDYWKVKNPQNGTMHIRISDLNTGEAIKLDEKTEEMSIIGPMTGHEFAYLLGNYNNETNTYQIPFVFSNSSTVRNCKGELVKMIRSPELTKNEGKDVYIPFFAIFAKIPLPCTRHYQVDTEYIKS